MTDFHSYLEQSGKSLGEIARAAGISYSYMADIARREKTPSLKTAAAIEDATDGHVPARHWLEKVSKK